MEHSPHLAVFESDINTKQAVRRQLLRRVLYSQLPQAARDRALELVGPRACGGAGPESPLRAV